MKPFNIVLIIVDTYRRDSASIFNEQLSRTSPLHPRMSSWHRFQRCFSSAPWTLPSCSSILAGIHSSTHNYFFQNRPLGRPTIANYLGDDYHKIGIVNNGNLKPFSGLNDGFDEYHYFSSHDEPYEKATQFLRKSDPSKPFFLFFHTNIPHDYYKEKSREYYLSSFPGREDWFSVGPYVGTWSGLSPDQRTRVRSLYDACVSGMERKLSTLLDVVDRERTILCFVADHGEGFDYDRARIHHGGRLHNDLIAVPLAIHLPSEAPTAHHAALAANRTATLSTSDICPTLLELVERPIPPGLDGSSILQNSAELSARCLPAEDRRYLYGPNRERFNLNRTGKNTSWWRRFKNRVGRQTVAKEFDLKGYIEYPYKLIITSYVRSRLIPSSSMTSMLRDRLFYPKAVLFQHEDLTVSVELFNLDSDPEEVDNLLTEQPAGALRDLVREKMKSYDRMSIVVDGAEHRLDSLLRQPPAPDSAQ